MRPRLIVASALVSALVGFIGCGSSSNSGGGYSTGGGTIPGSTFVPNPSPSPSPAASVPTVTSIVPTSGGAGVNVQITGSGFTGATGATIGGVAVQNFAVASDSTITGTTGSGGSGASDVVVTGPGGNGTLTGGFTIMAATPSPSPSAQPSPSPSPVALKFSTDMQTYFGASGKCTLCHKAGSGNPASAWPLDTYAAVTGGMSAVYTPAKYVVAGNSGSSLIGVCTQTGGNPPMVAMAGLSAADSSAIQTWIQQGAQQ